MVSPQDSMFEGLFSLTTVSVFNSFRIGLAVTTVIFVFAGEGVAVLCIGLAVRCFVAFLAVFGTNFNMKERFFIPLAWLPKATVQVGVASIICLLSLQYLPRYRRHICHLCLCDAKDMVGM